MPSPKIWRQRTLEKHVSITLGVRVTGNHNVGSGTGVGEWVVQKFDVRQHEAIFAEEAQRGPRCKFFLAFLAGCIGGMIGNGGAFQEAGWSSRPTNRRSWLVRTLQTTSRLVSRSPDAAATSVDGGQRHWSDSGRRATQIRRS